MGYNDVHGDFGFGDRNDDGASLFDFARSFGLVVVNSSFPKKEEHLITFCSRVSMTQIDFLLLRKGNRVLCKDCKVIQNENLMTQYRLLVMDFILKIVKKRKVGEGHSRVKWGDLTPTRALEIGAKEKYKVAKKEAKLVVTGAKSPAFERLYWGLEEIGMEKRLFRLAKSKKHKGWDLDRVKCIKGKDVRVLVEDVLILKRWHSYFHKILNDEVDRGIVLGELEDNEESHDFLYCEHFKVEEVCEAIRKMRRGRATGPNEILMDF
ncbi:uncharacterized protein LOC107857832 [Capsicum annuum]|uniref:uncharacterized protein LOC107857832 n=1 Tax=Capsicum annuum TaxID=4072 RepID=UPI0007BF85B7|nr:uncharacterized protein LOC107857832 [Capsicum annuum]